MLKQLSIKNFALVDHVSLEFGPSFNVLTGETGAGKSLIVDALYFLLGDRITADMMRAGEERTVVEALFLFSKDNSVAEKLKGWGVQTPGGELLIKREFTRSAGKTRSFINGELATASMVSEIGDMLVDIHGQHEHQAIFNIGQHRALIDSFGRLEKILEEVAASFQKLSSLLGERVKLGSDTAEITRRTDLLKYQVQEIEAAGLDRLNEEELLKKYQLAKHAEKITQFLTEALRLLNEGETGGATGLFGSVVARMQDATRLDPDLGNQVKTAMDLQESFNQLSLDLSEELGRYSFSKDEYETLSDQIDNLNLLKKKYGDSIEQILNYLGKAKDELRSLLGREERLIALDGEIANATEQYRDACRRLSRGRARAGKELSAQVQAALVEMGLTHAQLDVQLTAQENQESTVEENGKHMALSPMGWDRVEFLFSANPGESLRPLAKVASGGEASRVMLALKTVLAGSDEVATLIFDEIDTGVGARTASTVAKQLLNLSKTKQILCISHLAPIAVMGDWHYHIEKTNTDGKSMISLMLLNGEGRIRELARMLGGDPLTDISLSHAKDLYARMRRL
jgi:DNA repair protein RecN (Recombination protein N)